MTLGNSTGFTATPAQIRRKGFTTRRRGVDEHEVREYLAVLADQSDAAERHLRQVIADNDRLQAEMQTLRDAPEQKQGEITDQAVRLFSEAQIIADSLIEEAVQSARDLMLAARSQQHDIAAEKRPTAPAQVSGPSVAPQVLESALSVPEIEYVRTYARVAQVQLRAVLEALTAQVDKLGEVPHVDEQPELPDLLPEDADPFARPEGTVTAVQQSG